MIKRTKKYIPLEDIKHFEPGPSPVLGSYRIRGGNMGPGPFGFRAWYNILPRPGFPTTLGKWYVPKGVYRAQ